jgi:hypothetical protein
MLALIGSSVTLSPAQAGLDEKREVLAEWLVNFTIEALPDLTTAPQRATMPKTAEWLDALAIAPADPADWTPIRAVPGVLIKGTFKGDDQARFLLRLPKEWNGKLVVAGASGTRSEFNGDLVISVKFCWSLRVQFQASVPEDAHRSRRCSCFFYEHLRWS